MKESNRFHRICLSKGSVPMGCLGAWFSLACIPLAAAPSKGTLFPGRGFSPQKAGYKKYPTRNTSPYKGINPAKGHQFTAGLSVPARGVSTWQGYWSLAGVLVPIRGICLYKGHQSLWGISVPSRCISSCKGYLPLQGGSAPTRSLSPCKGHQPVWGLPWVIHANCSWSAINRCDKQPALATRDIMKVWLCKRLTDNNAIGNYRAVLYWISAVQNELRLAGHASPLLKCLLLLSFVIVSGSSGGWMRWGHVSNPHLFCITMQPSPPAADPECQCPPPKWTKTLVKTPFTEELGRLSLKWGC